MVQKTQSAAIGSGAAALSQTKNSQLNPAHLKNLAKDESSKKSDKNRGYQVQLSPEAQKREESIQKAYQIAKNSPEVNIDKVQKLKEKIKNGTYKVDSKKIADGMLREAIKDRLAMGD